MPIYEYQCTSCQHELEALQKMSDEPLKECPQCHQPSLKKKISAAGFRLSGSGWYETDFKKGGNKKNLVGGESGSGDATKKSEKAEKKADAKSGASATQTK